MAELRLLTPPPKLVGDWLTEAGRLHLLTPANLNYLATRAAQWGAAQELEACCEWVQGYAECGDSLRAARRPKPPSLKEQALEILKKHVDRALRLTDEAKADADTLRRAIEALPDE